MIGLGKARGAVVVDEAFRLNAAALQPLRATAPAKIRDAGSYSSAKEKGQPQTERLARCYLRRLQEAQKMNFSDACIWRMLVAVLV